MRSEESAGAIFGNTLKHLAGSHAGFHSATLTPTQSWTSYSNTPPYTYNPYPEYNTEAWKANNVGEYVPCDWPDGAITEVQVFSGYLEPFKEPILGSHLLLDVDSNLCFERMTRLGAYGYQDEESISEGGENAAEQRANWDKVNWRQLQEACVARNVNRFVPAEETTQESPIAPAETSSASAEIPSPPPIVYGTGDVRRATTVDAQAEVPEVYAQMKKRTAVLLRSTSGKNYTDNDLQNIRSLVTELALRTGGEYTVYLLVAAINDDRPLWSDASEETSRANVPKEFQDMAIIWNQAMMEKFYPKSEDEDKFHPSEWRPVQRFAHDYPQYEFFWNLDLDYRYTGHHYDLLEKLAAFAKAQPRKGLWERNERFYIPSVHGSYDSKFRATVERNSGSQTVWGAPTVEGVTPVGPVPLVMDPTDDDYTWGVGDDADYISLAPIFNPVNTHWPARDDIWGYAGAEETPRRATVGMNSRCSKKMLQTMDAENLRGNHIGSEMGPPTVALLHGLKAVFAPIPIYFDRAWPGSSLDEFLNPGLKGVSGGVVESPFSQGREFALEGATWSAQSLVPKRLYCNWMGWEYEGIGGPEVGPSFLPTCGVLTMA